MALGASPVQAETLVDNVDGFTLTADGQIMRFNGLLVGTDGRIAQVLQRGERRPGKIDYLVDGKGRVLMPGLVDAHARVMALGFAGLTLDLSGTRSLDEALARISAYAAAHPDRPWILGGGWDVAAWGLTRPLTAADLDAVAGGRPVWLTSADGTAGWASTAALTAAAIGPATKAPPGGRIERAGTGKPSGVLVETAMMLVEQAVPAPRPEDRDLALVRAQDTLLSRGITTVTDMGTTIADWQAYRRAGDLGALRVRIIGYAAGTEAMSLIAGPGPSPWLYEDRLRLNGVFLALDGALASRAAWLAAPYADAPGQTVKARLTPTQLRNLMSRAAIDRFQVAVAAHGDAAVAATLDAVSELAQTYAGDRRWRIEGGEVIAPADVTRLAATGAVAVLRPARIPPDQSLTEARLGPPRAGQAWPVAALARTGARLAFGTGAPASGPDPFGAIAATVTRANGPVTREDALAAWTTGAARAGQAEGRLGRLDVGQRADFVLLDRDPLLVSTGDLRATRVLETWVGGRKVWAAPEGR